MASSTEIGVFSHNALCDRPALLTRMSIYKAIMKLLCKTIPLSKTEILYLNTRNIIWIQHFTDTQKSASHLDLHIEIYNGGRLKTKLQQA